ncbi:MAG TPA: hypothetical protein VKU19_29815 [Bryobacteraceae bacterium]|nr:hypothetical protein [Bryobacteraceae bacterium]
MRSATLLAPCIVLLLGGCSRMARSYYLSGYDRDIRNSTRDIQGARSDAERAVAYSRRGRAYSEKGRYSRFARVISDEEYARLFELAISDHGTAVKLAPASGEVYFSRGQTYYDRAAFGDPKDLRPWSTLATADFQAAAERDATNHLAWDMLGMAHLQSGELDEAIRDFTRETELDSFGRVRLADAYCTRAGVRQREHRDDAATEDYEKSLSLGAPADSCDCEPYNPLLYLYDHQTRYDKAWEIVAKAKQANRWIAPELLDQLKKDSGRIR